MDLVIHPVPRTWKFRIAGSNGRAAQRCGPVIPISPSRRVMIHGEIGYRHSFALDRPRGPGLGTTCPSQRGDCRLVWSGEAAVTGFGGFLPALSPGTSRCIPRRWPRLWTGEASLDSLAQASLEAGTAQIAGNQGAGLTPEHHRRHGQMPPGWKKREAGAGEALVAVTARREGW